MDLKSSKMRYFLSILSLILFLQTVKAQVNQVDDKGRKQGVWEKKWKNGKIKYRAKFKNDKHVGEYLRYDDKGKLTGKLYFFGESGERASVYLYYTNGEIQASGIYQNQKRDSLWRFYSESKELVKETFYTKGIKNGWEKEYYRSGQLKVNRNYKNGVEDGEFIEYFENGAVKTKTVYVNGNPNGSFSTYYSDNVPRVLGKYNNGLKTGKWIFYSSTAKVEKEEIYENGEMIYTTEEIITYWNDSLKIIRTREKFDKNGISTFKAYYPNGNIYREGYYNKGKKDSIWTYHTIEGGADTLRHFYKGQKHGMWQINFPNGKAKVEKSYLNNKLEGEYREYFANGQLKVKGEYKKGQRVGPWVYYNEKGEVVKTLNDK